ncbi:MAG: D-alanyl-D-alanine carboxypeptidase family protein, partial [Candidatus Zixiibacteriota bacterium]
MVDKKSLPKVLLMLAGFVFFFANTVHILETGNSEIQASINPNYEFVFGDFTENGLGLNLKAAILVNYDDGKVLYARNAELERPIASLTKLISAMVIIDKGTDLSRTEIITREDAYRSSRSRLRVGYELTLEDLLVAALMNSDNRAMRALARACSGTQDAFSAEMNWKVRTLGLTHTVFIEPTGLDSRNVSTAEEVAKIVHYAYKYPLIEQITADKQRKVTVLSSRGRKLQMANTNLLVLSQYNVLAGKTGYIRAADYCVAALVENKAGEKLTAVV